MIRVLRNSGLLGVLLLAGCQQSTSAISLRSLAQSGTMSVLCRDMTTGQGTDIKGCPDAYATSNEGRHTLLMVTQTGRGEIAVIDMHNRVVLDQDPSVPGTEFLPIGALPVSIISTPGGVATFVATAEPGREAIFALPTSCVVAPPSGQPPHDLTQWSACKLPSSPGEMALLTDTALDTSGQLRRSCDGNGTNDLDVPSQADCPADWDAEQQVSTPGRRKILITLPKLGRIAIMDARQLSNRTPGKFEPCNIERLLPLSTVVPAAAPPQEPGCQLTPRYSYGPASAFFSQPAGISLKDGKLYVADLGVPLVHVVDVSNPCDPHETVPFLPSSLDEPGRAVFTSDVAVSDMTSQNERFVYAVDEGNGSLMAFDASEPSAANAKAPIIRGGSQYLPFEAPDRIRTNLQNARVKDLLFIKHDVPVAEEGALTSQTGVLCDPSQNAPTLASQYVTSSDYTRGASPSKLRGIFAVAALSDGYVSLIDVDDWDAKCRRPVVGNRAQSPDWRGCFADSDDRYDIGTRTASDESSCNIMEPHHARSSRFIGNNATLGIAAPSLQSFPTLTSVGGTLSTAGTSSIAANPRMLAVPYASNSAAVGNPAEYSELYVGSSHYYIANPELELANPPVQVPDNSAQLSSDPRTAEQSSLLLPQVEPRAYLPSENFSLTYEGKLFDDRVSGYLSSASLKLSDPDASFCDQGVQDIDVAAKRASEFISGTDGAAFASAYGDILQVTSDFSDADPYWRTPTGSACAQDPETGVSGIAACRNYFGITDEFSSHRDWQITEAYQDHLIFRPADATADAAKAAEAIANLHCCFPGTVKYTVRAKNHWLLRGQQPMHNIAVGPNSRCVVEDSCTRRQLLKNRVLEISSTNWKCDLDPSKCTCKLKDQDCSIGPAMPRDIACVVSSDDPSSFYSGASALGQGCVLDSIRGRFALYRGINPSVRDMEFRWQVVGGFVPYELNLANRLTGSAIMPQSLIPAPNLNALFVVDGVSGGVFEISLTPFGVIGDPYL